MPARWHWEWSGLSDRTFSNVIPLAFALFDIVNQGKASIPNAGNGGNHADYQCATLRYPARVLSHARDVGCNRQGAIVTYSTTYSDRLTVGCVVAIKVPYYRYSKELDGYLPD